jgi:glycosyltransferase involved in cell wall biosynthesis
MDPAVSVCVPTWNGERYLAETLQSALAQTFADFELLVVDDGSTDRTLEIAESVRDPRLRVQRNPRREGLPGNWNRCLQLARGRYVLLLCQDDVLAAEALGALRDALEGAPDAVLAFGRREIRYDGIDCFPLQGRAYQEALASFHRSWRASVTGIDFVAGALRDGRDLTVNVIGEPSFVLVKREAALGVGGFDAAFRQLPDWDLWLRLGQRGSLVFVDRVLGAFRVHAGGASARGLVHVPSENVRLLLGLRRLYGPRLDRAARRRLRGAEWRHRWRLLVHALGRIIRL